jgi:uncharacterized protein with PIN domain
VIGGVEVVGSYLDVEVDGALECDVCGECQAEVLVLRRTLKRRKRTYDFSVCPGCASSYYGIDLGV